MVPTILAVLAVFSILVYVHELGHYVAARCAGIRVDEFGFGYPPRLALLFRRGVTEYTLNAIPIGGFVRMAGMPGDEDPTDPEGFNSKSRGARVAALLAGSSMNVLLAVLLFAVVSAIGEPVEIERLAIMQVVGQSPAYEAGISYGDVIVTVEGEPVHNFYELSRWVEKRAGHPMSLTLDRGGGEVTVVLTPRRNPPAGEGAMGVGIESTWIRTEIIRRPPWEAVSRGLTRTWDTVSDIYRGIVSMLGGLFKAEEETPAGLTGPVGIGFIVSEVARSGEEHVTVRLMLLTAVLSVNLGLINLFPFPALDGGRLLFIVIEWLRGGKRFDPRREGYVHLIGIAVILGFFVVVSYLDFARLALR